MLAVITIERLSWFLLGFCELSKAIYQYPRECSLRHLQKTYLDNSEMESVFRSCIFCTEALSPDEVKGQGDHIIPKFLHGSLRFKAICRKCNNTLGNLADHLALEDERIIGAVFSLNLPELQQKILDRSKCVLVDEENEYEIPIRRLRPFR